MVGDGFVGRPRQCGVGVGGEVAEARPQWWLLVRTSVNTSGPRCSGRSGRSGGNGRRGRSRRGAGGSRRVWPLRSRRVRAVRGRGGSSLRGCWRRSGARRRRGRGSAGGRRRGRSGIGRRPASGPSDLELGPIGCDGRRGGATNAGNATRPNECCSLTGPCHRSHRSHRSSRDGRSGRSGRSRSCRGRELVAFTAAGRSTLTLLALLATGPAAQGHLGLGGLADRADDGDVAQQRVRECPTHVGEAIVKRFGRGAHRHTGQANGTMPEICPGRRFCCGAGRIRSGTDR